MWGRNRLTILGSESGLGKRAGETLSPRPRPIHHPHRDTAQGERGADDHTHGYADPHRAGEPHGSANCWRCVTRSPHPRRGRSSSTPASTQHPSAHRIPGRHPGPPKPKPSAADCFEPPHWPAPGWTRWRSSNKPSAGYASHPCRHRHHDGARRYPDSLHESIMERRSSPAATSCPTARSPGTRRTCCLLYTSDAADE